MTTPAAKALLSHLRTKQPDGCDLDALAATGIKPLKSTLGTCTKAGLVEDRDGIYHLTEAGAKEIYTAPPPPPATSLRFAPSEIVQRSVVALVPDARNARTHNEDQVAALAGVIRTYGWTAPVLIGPDDGIIAGHGRVLAARKLGLTQVPCIVLPHLTADERRAYLLADNRMAELAGWDDQILAQELKALEAAGMDLSGIGWDEKALSDLEAFAADPVTGQTDPDDVPDTPVGATITQPGDIWILGNHRLVCGDSTKADTYRRLLEGASVDMMLTDPPYNVEYKGKTDKELTIKNDSMSDEQFRQFLGEFLAACLPCIKPGASYYIWHADVEGFNFQGACREVGLQVRQVLIWVKNVMVLGRQDYQWRHEPCIYGWKDGAAHTWLSDRSQTTVLEFDKPARNGEHPTMKPVALFAYQLLNSCPADGLVLDPFGGSGTTLMAAEQNHRRARLVELDPRYCDVIVKRWENFTGRIATRAEA